MKYLLIQYPKCSTCQKAEKWLKENNISYETRHIVEDCPKFEELEEWIKRSGYQIKKFFNTSGMIYREKGLKEKLNNLSKKEQIQLLASNGMLIKRPLLIGEDIVLVGFRQSEWQAIIEK